MQNDQSKIVTDPAKFTDEQTDKRIHEHLVNKDDVISEEDIKNVRTDIRNEEQIPVSSEQPEIQEDQDASLENEKIKDNEEPDVETPWNILGNNKEGIMIFVLRVLLVLLFWSLLRK